MKPNYELAFIFKRETGYSAVRRVYKKRRFKNKVNKDYLLWLELQTIKLIKQEKQIP
jgi:hypothetical protein